MDLSVWAFFLCAAALVYIYAGFPLCLVVATWRRRYLPDEEGPDEELPSVTMIVAAYNEELVIAEKLRNCLAINYPADKLDFVFVSDSNDGTNEILCRKQSSRIHVRLLPERRGKIVALEAAFGIAAGEILVLSDANTFYRPNAIRKLVRHFRNPQVGVVTGDVRILPSAEAFGAGEGLYYRYERGLQMLETRFWSTVAIDGAMYALRKRQLRPVTSTLVPDDFATGMNIARQGMRVVYDPEAIAEEPPTPSDAEEFHRKVRMVAAGIQSFLEGEGVPPWTQGRLVWAYVSHKLLRWLAPVFILGALASSIAAGAHSPLFRWIVCVEALFGLLALAGWKWQRWDSRFFRVPYYFSMVNLAALRGVIRGLRKGEGPVWARTRRDAESIKSMSAGASQRHR